MLRKLQSTGVYFIIRREQNDMKKQFTVSYKLKVWLLWPILINLAIAGLVCLLTNKHYAMSAFVGGMVAVIPQAVFGFYSFRYSGAQQSKLIWRSFVRGEAIKLFLTGLLFALVFMYVPVKTLWFLLAFIIMQFAGIVVNCRLLEH